jgi:hypothetical protein
MPVVKLNARNITTLQAVGGARTEYRDELLPGFFLRDAERHANVRHRLHDARRPPTALHARSPRSARPVPGAGAGQEAARGRSPGRRRDDRPRTEAHGSNRRRLGRGFPGLEEALAWRPKTRQEFARAGPRSLEAPRGQARRGARPRRSPVRPGAGHGAVTRRLYTWAIGKDLVETSPCVGLIEAKPRDAQRVAWSN